MSKMAPRTRSDVGRTPGRPEARGRGGLLRVRPRALPPITRIGGPSGRLDDVERDLLARADDAVADDEHDLVRPGLVRRDPRGPLAVGRAQSAFTRGPRGREKRTIRLRQRHAAAVR